MPLRSFSGSFRDLTGLEHMHRRATVRRSSSHEELAHLGIRCQGFCHNRAKCVHRNGAATPAAAAENKDPVPSAVAGHLGAARREVVVGLASAVLSWTYLAGNAEALPQTKTMEAKVQEALSTAFTEEGIPDVAEAAWTEAIRTDPVNVDAWENRGTCRLQFGQWEEAVSDFDKALQIEEAIGLKEELGMNGGILNKRGTAKAALGDWVGAIDDYELAMTDAEVAGIARANLALASFQVGRERRAIRLVENILDTNPGNLDAHCAYCAFLWGCGYCGDAKSEWSELQGSTGGLGGVLYNRESAVERVRGRWPPRAIAALSAFLDRSKFGVAMDAAGVEQMYSFG